MANEEPKQVVITEQDGAVDSILTYLKERIESPLLMSFLFSWSVINRDFLFYLFMSNDSNKHNQLTQWDFSGFIFNFSEPFWYSPWADSFWYPLFYGALMALLFSPVSMVLSGCRYYVLSKVASFVQNNKNSFDLAHAIKVAEKHLKGLGQEIKDKTARRAVLARDIEKCQKEIEATESDLVTNKLGGLAPFLIQAARFDAEYKLGTFSNKTGTSSNKIYPNSIIEVRIRFFHNKNKSLDAESESDFFKGTAYEFFTSGSYFSLETEQDLSGIKKIMENLSILGEINCPSNGGLTKAVHLLRSTTFDN